MSFKDKLDKEAKESMEFLDKMMEPGKQVTREEFQDVLKHGQILLNGFNRLFDNLKGVKPKKVRTKKDKTI